MVKKRTMENKYDALNTISYEFEFLTACYNRISDRIFLSTNYEKKTINISMVITTFKSIFINQIVMQQLEMNHGAGSKIRYNVDKYVYKKVEEFFEINLSTKPH